MIRIDTAAAAIAKRLSVKHRRRASEIYPLAASYLKAGIEEQEAEQKLDALCQLLQGDGDSLNEILMKAVDHVSQTGEGQ